MPEWEAEQDYREEVVEEHVWPEIKYFHLKLMTTRIFFIIVEWAILKFVSILQYYST